MPETPSRPIGKGILSRLARRDAGGFCAEADAVAAGWRALQLGTDEGYSRPNFRL